MKNFACFLMRIALFACLNVGTLVANAQTNNTPTVSLTSPTMGSRFIAPANVTLTATASDTDGSITKVEFYYGSTLLSTDTTAPYSYVWNYLSPGIYGIYAKAYDNLGAVGIRDSYFTVVPNNLPNVILASPKSGSTFTAPATINLGVHASDLDGSITKVEIYNGSTRLYTATAPPYSYVWSGVGPGTYSIIVRAYDNLGAQNASVASSITVVAAANNTPTVSLTAPTSGASFTGPATVTLTATASDTDGSITRVEFYSGTALLGTDTSAPYSFAWVNVPVGSHSVRALAYDNQGAASNPSAVQFSVKAPNSPPGLTLTSPTAGASFTAPATVTLTATASDTDGSVTRVEFYNGSTLLNSDTAAPYSFVWSGVGTGTYSITARAFDNLGAVRTSTAATVTVVAATNSLPNVTLTAPTSGSSFTAPATVTLTATASDTDGSITRVEFYNGATLLNTDTTAPYSYVWSGVGTGTYSITARAFDNLGAVRTSAASTVTVVAAANSLPNVTLTSPTSGASFTAPATVTLTATASDTDGSITRVEFLVNSNAFAMVATDTTAPYSYAWAALGTGTYSITARAYDNLGAVRTSAASTVTVVAAANSLPNVTLTSPTSGASFTAPATVTLTATASDTDGSITRVEFYNGSTLLNTDTAAPYSYVWSGVGTGTYSITARAFDNLGAVRTSAASSITVVAAANSLPNVTLTSPTSGSSFTAPATVTLTATASDTDGSITRVEFYNGATLLNTDTAAPYSFVWSGVGTGTYSITARAYDNLGAQRTSAASSITVVAAANSLPNVTLTAPTSGSSFTAPATVTLTATASDTDGSITRVEFYNGATLLNSDTAAPYSFVWSGVGTGTYSITARAYDNLGAQRTSAASSITVVAAANSLPNVTLTAPTSGSSFTAPATVTLTATASDTDGSITRVEFYNGATLLNSDTAAPYSFVWSGVGTGTYSITARAFDNLGAQRTSAASTVTVAAAANSLPNVTLTAPTSGSSFTAPATVTLTATASDTDGSITRVEFYNGATLLNTDTAAPYSYVWSGVGTGTYSITARAFDNLGAQRTSAASTVTVAAAANSLPNVTLTSPTSGSSFTAPATVTLTATASDTDGSITRVEFYNGATLLNSDTAAPYSYVWSGVGTGTYSITARAYDNLGGQRTSAASSITVVAAANSLPNVTLTSPTSGSSFTAPATVTLTATASDTDGSITRVEFYNGATLLNTDTTAPYSYVWSGVGTGTYSITARAYDNLGAVRTSTAATVTVVAAANSLPNVTLTAPTSGSSFTAPATVTLTATASDTDGSITRVEFYNGATLLNTDTAAPYSYVWSGVGTGTYSITARAYDNLGGQRTSAASSITVAAAANSLPNVTLTSPTSGSSFTAPATVTLTATASDTDGSITRVEFYNGATLLNTDTAAPYSYVWSGVGTGTYSITARAYDNLGAVRTSAASTVTVVAAPVAATTLYFVHPDHLGTPRMVADAAGVTVWRWDNLEPFGLTGVQTDPDGNGQAFVFNLRFAGQYFDAESGLFHNRHRDYDSASGRYVQADPIGLAGGISLYSYVGANPLGFVDPLGLARQQCGTQGNAAKGVGRLPGPATDKAGNQIGRIIVDSKGNAMIEPAGGKTVAAGKGGVDTHTLYPNGSNYQRLNPQGHANNPTPHGHGHAPGTGPGMKGQGPSLDVNGNVVPWNSPAAHWPIN